MDGTRFRLLLKSLPLLAATGLAPACSDTPVDVGNGDSLTEAEAFALANAVGLQSLDFGQQQGASSTAARVGRPLATQSISIDYDVTRPCLLGGSVTSSGNVSVETDEAADHAIVDIVATEAHHACVFQVEDTRVSVTGDPDITTTVHAESLAGESTGTQSVAVAGAFTWASDDGRNGRCSVDILVEVNEDTATQTTRGDFCGFSFDVTVTAS